jgi:iron complex transport system substrate-binding protein
MDLGHMKERTMRKLSAAACSIIAVVAATALPAGASTRTTAVQSATLPSGVSTPRLPQSTVAPAAHTPKRILSLSASATQMLYSIGAGNQVVGVDKYSSWPANAPRTKFTGSETDAEDYLGLRPDLVVFAYASPKMLGQLRSLGIRTVVLAPATTMAAIYAQMEQLGSITGHRPGAARAVASMRQAVGREVATAKGAGKGETYYVELDPTYFTATSSTFIGAEFSLFGMRDVADAAGRGATYPQITKEYLLKANPDYVFLADTVCCHADAANFGRRPGFSVLRAVRDHHVIAVNDSVASEWGPHTVEQFVSTIAGVLKS